MAMAGKGSGIPKGGFKDREQLAVWLEDQPREVALAIAWRSAARVFPLLAGEKPDAVILPTLRAIAVSRFAANWPNHETEQVKSAAYSAAHSAARSAALSAAIWGQVTKDARLFEEQGVKALYEAPLWFEASLKPQGLNALSWVHQKWTEMEQQLSNLPVEQDWLVWLHWYDDILRGKPGPTGKVDIEFARLFGHPDAGVKITEDDWKAGPSVVNSKIRQVLDWFDGRKPPDVPEQKAGVGFVVNEDGQIDLATTGTPTASDIDELEAMRPLLLEALDDLIASCAGSNAFSQIARFAQSYKSTLEGPIERASIDRMYGYGLRLDIANVHMRKEIEDGSLPETSLSVGEGIDSVLAIHGTAVLSTERGKLLLDRSRDYNRSRGEELEYKERSRAFANAVATKAEFVVREAKDYVREVNEDIGEGRFPERSGDQARTVNFNLIAKMATIVLMGTSPIWGQAVVQSIPGQELATSTTQLIDAAWTFLSGNSYVLRDLAAAGGPELNWVRSLLNWMERKGKPTMPKSGPARVS